MTTLLKSSTNEIHGHIPGTEDTQELIKAVSHTPLGKQMLTREFLKLWIIMDTHSKSGPTARAYRELYRKALDQLGADVPSPGPKTRTDLML